jgi:simple sugar transport system permease protein
MLPFIATLVVLIFFSKTNQGPKANGIPYQKGGK